VPFKKGATRGQSSAFIHHTHGNLCDLDRGVMDTAAIKRISQGHTAMPVSPSGIPLNWI